MFCKKIYTFIDDATSLGEHYYNLVDGFNPSVDQFKGCLVVSVYNGATTYIMPYLYNDDVELLEITKDGKFYKISNVSMDELGDTTYIYDRTQLSYSKTEIDTKESAIYNAGNIIKSMFFAIGAEIIGVAIFCALEINMDSDFYYMLYTIFSSSIFFVVIIISFLLNYRFIIKKAKISARQKVVVSILVAIATAPYLFLLPLSPLGY